MNIVLLSGGSGKRLWPLSNGVRSKQFIKFLKKEDGSYESMLQRMHRQIICTMPDAKVTVVTSKSQISTVINQLEEAVDICAEPCRRDTFPAVCLAAAYLRDVKGLDLEEPVVICPTDPYVDETYYLALLKLSEAVREHPDALFLLGMKPTYPSAKYGYIQPADEKELSAVSGFWEKPDENTAKKLLESGALWNGGVFASSLGFFCDMAQKRFGFEDYEDLFQRFSSLPPLSFDREAAEKEKKRFVLRYDGEWKDLGTWNTLTEAMVDDRVGNAILDQSCDNVHVINDLDVPVLCMGLSDVVISASPEGILVADKEHSSYIGPYVEQIGQQTMFAEKSWGSFRVLDVEEESMTIKVILNPGHGMNYHSHERRDEVWTIISGSGRTIVDGMEQPVKTGDVITMQAGCRHTIIADTELNVIEVQLGREISVHDKKKYELEK